MSRLLVPSLAMVAVAGCIDGTVGTSMDAQPTCDRPGLDCDVQLEPPETGFQLDLGPTEVAEGAEAIRCFWRQVPTEYDVTRFELRNNIGSHHVDIYAVNYPMPDGDDFDCAPGPGRPGTRAVGGLNPEKDPPHPVVGFQHNELEWSLPEGVGYRLRVGQQLLIQVHFVNVPFPDTGTGRLHSIINFHASSEPVAQIAGTLLDDDQDIVIPPKSKLSLTRICEFPEPVTLIGMTGHFHARGTRYRVWNYNPATGGTGEPTEPWLYESTRWDTPPFVTDDEWQAPIESVGIKMIADYYNALDRDVVSGCNAAENERFKTYAFFYPSLGVDSDCFCHREGEAPQCGQAPADDGDDEGSGGSGGSGGEATASCTDQYGTVSGFQLCEETATTCAFYALKSATKSCADVCMESGGQCVDAWGNGPDNCSVAPEEVVDCYTSDHVDDVCVCTLGSG